jgi:hypothetical protein
MYDDDVVIFLKPTRLDLDTCTAVVEDFVETSGLHTNRAKLGPPHPL